MAKNQHSVTGPNTAPMPAVPRRCAANSATRMMQLIGTTNDENALVATSSPSTADSTVMAGVITPSP